MGTVYKKGVTVTVRSCDGSNPIYSIGSRKDIKHYVNIKNYKLYPINFSCNAAIRSRNQKIEFHSPCPTVTKSKWTINRFNFTGNHIINHVNLIARKRGTEGIHTKVNAVCPHKGQDIPIEINIFVSGL